MEKPYDIKALVAKYKASGLEVGEEAAKAIFSGTMEWVEESAAASESKIDDMIVGLIQPAKPYILEQIEKINPAG